MTLNVYLSGEIHTNWRDEIREGARKMGLDIMFTSANTSHEASDAAGDCLGEETNQFWRDHRSARVNSMRTKTLIEKSDIVIIRFGDKYRQWNAAFDAGYCAALGKPYITMHEDELIHPRKEVDAHGMARARSSEEILHILAYVAGEN